MQKLRKKIYMIAGYNTISMGTGRKEFNPKKERAGLEEYMKEAGQAVLQKIGGAQHVDEGVIGNFIASRFNRQANMAAFFPYIDEGLRHKPAVRVEGACATGALALVTAMRSILAETAEVVLVVGQKNVRTDMHISSRVSLTTEPKFITKGSVRKKHVWLWQNGL